MNICLRSFAFGAALLATGAMCAQSAPVTVFEDDFEWLAGVDHIDSPTKNNDVNGNPIVGLYDEVGNDDPNKTSYNFAKNGFKAGEGVTTIADKCEALGYKRITTTVPGKERAADNNMYIHKNYLKFGLTDRYAGIGFPMPKAIKSDAAISFDWCSQRAGSGKFDATKLVVVVVNGDEEQQFEVPYYEYPENSAHAWRHEEVSLAEAKILEGTYIYVRNADEQWPASKGAFRWYFDNVKVTGVVGGEEPAAGATLTEVWKSHNGFTADVRSGSGALGKIYLPNGTKIDVVDKDGNVTTIYEHTGGLNKGIFVDDAGNMLVHNGFPLSAANWKNFLLISADGQTVKEITLSAPTEDEAFGNRADVQGRAIGDFFSEEGGLCFLTAQTFDYPIPIWIANGEQVETEYSTSTHFSAAHSMASAVPSIETMDEADVDEVRNQYYYYTGSSAWNIGYVGEEDAAAYLPEPAYDAETKTYIGLPEGWNKQTQNGFDVVTLNGKKYMFRMCGPGTWCSDFIVNDEEGNVVAHTNCDMANGWGSVGKTGNGCNLVVRKTSEYTADVYQVFKSGDLAASFAAVYTFAIPEPIEPTLPLYAAGSFQGWNPGEPAEFTYADGKYTLAIKSESDVQFKMSTTKGSWDEFNANVIGVKGNAIALDVPAELEAGNGSDISILAGDYTLTVDLAANTATLTGEEYKFNAPEFYLRGGFNGWGYDDASKFATDGQVNADGNVIYTLSLPVLEGEVKIADKDWVANLGGPAIPEAGTYTLERGGGNMNVTRITDVKLTLTYPKLATAAPTLVVEGNQYVDRKAFAYDINATFANGSITFTYKASAPATAAKAVLYPAEGDPVVLDLPAPVKGANEAVVSAANLPLGKYTWQLDLTSELAGDKVGVAYKAPAEWLGGAYVRGGVVWIRDSKEAAYGYTAVAMGKNKGFVVYNPEGELVTEQPVFVGYDKLDSNNQSSVFRGDALRGYAVFGDWSDKASGAWLIDPLNLTQEPRNMFMVEGATQEGSGKVTYNGVATGSGTSTVAFQGEGADTKMFMFDEDIYGNCLVRYDLGEANSVMAAPTLVMDSYKTKMANTNIEVEAIETGFFVSQVRANANDAGVPALMFFDNEGALIWDSGNKDILGENTTDTGISSGVAVNADRSRLALSGNNCIFVFDLEFDEYDEPVLSNCMQFPVKVNGNTWMQLTFDAADNLHVFNRTGVGYEVYVLPGETTATTPAKPDNVISVESGIENVTVGAEGAVEYFNLQGVRVPAENLTPGIYVRRQGNTATKVVVK